MLLQEVDVQGGRGFCLKQVSDKQIIKRKNTNSFTYSKPTQITFALKMLLQEVDVQGKRNFCPKQVSDKIPNLKQKIVFS